MVNSVDSVKKTIDSQRSGFINFIKEQGVIGLAVGFILGGASASLFKSLTEDILNPIIAVILGSENGIKSWIITIDETDILIGNFLFTLLDFLVLLLVVYIAVKILRVDRFDKKKEEK